MGCPLALRKDRPRGRLRAVRAVGHRSQIPLFGWWPILGGGPFWGGYAPSGWWPNLGWWSCLLVGAPDRRYGTPSNERGHFERHICTGIPSGDCTWRRGLHMAWWFSHGLVVFTWRGGSCLALWFAPRDLPRFRPYLTVSASYRDARATTRGATGSTYPSSPWYPCQNPQNLRRGATAAGSLRSCYENRAQAQRLGRRKTPSTPDSRTDSGAAWVRRDPGLANSRALTRRGTSTFWPVARFWWVGWWAGTGRSARYPQDRARALPCRQDKGPGSFEPGPAICSGGRI